MAQPIQTTESTIKYSPNNNKNGEKPFAQDGLVNNTTAFYSTLTIKKTISMVKARHPEVIIRQFKKLPKYPTTFFEVPTGSFLDTMYQPAYLHQLNPANLYYTVVWKPVEEMKQFRASIQQQTGKIIRAPSALPSHPQPNAPQAAQKRRRARNNKPPKKAGAKQKNSMVINDQSSSESPSKRKNKNKNRRTVQKDSTANPANPQPRKINPERRKKQQSLAAQNNTQTTKPMAPRQVQNQGKKKNNTRRAPNQNSNNEYYQDNWEEQGTPFMNRRRYNNQQNSVPRVFLPRSNNNHHIQRQQSSNSQVSNYSFRSRRSQLA